MYDDSVHSCAITEVLDDTTTKYDINLNFTQFCLTLYRITTNEEIVFISHSSFLVPRNYFVYRFSLVFGRHQFQVSMLQVLPTATPHSRLRQHSSKCY